MGRSTYGRCIIVLRLGDGKIDMTEYVDGMSVYGYSKTASEEAFRRFAVVSLKQFGKRLARSNCPTELLQDESGECMQGISQETWSRYFHDLFYSTDRNALGNHLLGICDV